jgi:argininosuccinate lyase
VNGPGVVWGGRFRAEPHPEMMRLTRSLEIDMRLLEIDARSTRAHARVLAAAGLLSRADLEAIDGALNDLVARADEHRLNAAGDEDVHSFLERVLTERLGDVGARVHAGRSRNDLVATDLRLWCKETAEKLAGLVADVLSVIATRAEEHLISPMPGYTHLQRAQFVSLGFHLLAHGFALARDGQRFLSARASADSCVLGAGALAGTTLPLDSRVAAEELGFTKTFENAMDAVSDRDFACDLVYAAAMCAVHLSRLAEEIVLWTSAEFDTARLPDEWSTGSSMMPNKRNPDLAELMRGRSAPAIGDVTALLTLLKSVPLAYGRDLQEDKAIVFRACDRIEDGLLAARYLLEAIDFPERPIPSNGAMWATDLAEALVARGVPFRDAHRAVGGLVADLEERGISLESASEEDLKRHHESLSLDDRELADAGRSIRLRTGRGGTAPERVEEQIEQLRARARELRA